MSSVCPNCGSAQIEPIGPHPVYTCGSVFRVDLGRLDTDPPCALIRSLREELAAARDAYNYASDTGVRDRIALRRAETRAANLRAERDEMKRIAAKSERDAERMISALSEDE